MKIARDLMTHIPETTRAIIAASRFSLLPEDFRYVSAVAVRHPERHRLVHRDAHEVTVITTEAQLDDLDVLAINPDVWRLFDIACANPFYCVGFINAITVPMTAAGIDVLVISTFSRDLVLVKNADVERARFVLLDAGFQSAD